MSTSSATIKLSQNLLFRIGWIILLLAAGLMTLNHVSLLFILKEPILYLGWAAFNIYALLVIAIPFRQTEKWSWFASWLLPIGLGAGGLMDAKIGIYYLAVTVACVLGLLLTMRGFFGSVR